MILTKQKTREFLWKLKYYPEPLLMFYLYGVLFSAPILEQYLFKVFSDRVGYNYTYNSNTKNSDCDSSAVNSTERILLKKVQDEISKFQLLAMIVQNVPPVILILFFGPLSDRIGRKPILLVGFIGYTCWCIILTCIVFFKLDILYVYVANFIWGASGYYLAMVVAIIAYVADTTSPQSRPFRIAVVDFMLFLAITSSNFSSGVILQYYGFDACFLMMLVIAVISTLYCIFFLGESLPPDKRAVMKPVFSLPMEIYKILKIDRPTKWQLKLLIPLDATVGCTAPVTILQVLVLILLNNPFCWPSNWIGFYRGTLFVVMGIGGVVAVKLLPKIMNKSVVIIIANVSSAAFLVLFALSRNKNTAYLSIIAGVFSFSSQPITRGLISQAVTVSEQGAVFSLLGFFQTLISLIASLAYNAIYIYTNKIDMPGAVFIVASGTMFIPISICIAYYFKEKKMKERILAVGVASPSYGSTASSSVTSSNENYNDTTKHMNLPFDLKT